MLADGTQIFQGYLSSSCDTPGEKKITVQKNEFFFKSKNVKIYLNLSLINMTLHIPYWILPTVPAICWLGGVI